MNGAQGGNLQNVLSISTAANNRYLLHFNSLNSLTQWTAGIRLAMFEHSTLQEAYTGSLIAGKGKFLNNIRQIMERSKFLHEDWARVRFGAGTPWRRCWCVITPPDEKEYQKAQKTLKKGSSYSRAPPPKGDIKFYETRKVTKKTKPIATITDAFAAYAIYPQSKPLIDQSTLVKLEGLVTIHGGQETTTEGFVFVMPEVHAAVSGFEMMLRWLFPVYDTFALYGRPSRLIADTLDQRGLMFAMPAHRRYGYLDTLDVSGLIHTKGSSLWSERQWRKEMKKLTSTRMMNQVEDSPRHSGQLVHRRNTTSRNSLPPTRSGVQFQEPVIHSSPGSRSGSPARIASDKIAPPKRTDSAPPQTLNGSPHKRSISDAIGYRKYMTETRSRLSHEASRPSDFDEPPPPPRHGGTLGRAGTDLLARTGSDYSEANSPYEQVVQSAPSPYLPPPEPVLSPPAMTHNPNSRPPNQPYQAPELRRAHSNVDAATLYQMQDATRPADDEFVDASEQAHSRGDAETLPYRNTPGMAADPFQGFANNADVGNGRQQRDQRQRLSTIPGSPFTGNETEYFHTTTGQGQMAHLDQVVESRHEQQKQARPDLVQLHSSSSVARKPVPRKLPDVPNNEDDSASQQASQVRASVDSTPNSPVSAGSLYDVVVDQEALENILNNVSGRTSTMASSATPDYASTNSSAEKEAKQEQPREWKRPGKLKTVGNADIPATETRSATASKLDTFRQEQAKQSADMPTVDFGPTFSYKPSSRPGTSGTITPGDMERRSRSRSADRLRQSSGSRLSGYFVTPSPGESKRESYFGGRVTPTGIDSGESPKEHANKRQSIAWTPPVATNSEVQQKRHTLTPEEWVQQRASLAAQPQAPQQWRTAVPQHQRQSSLNLLQQHRQSMAKTPPPLSRTPSGEWSQQQRRQSVNKTPPPFSRTLSGDWTQTVRDRTPPSRPNSRGAGTMLASGSGGRPTSTTLTAKEQMHIARATGTPLINMAPKSKEHEVQAPGLVGALAARDREKAAMAQGIRNDAVAQAIAARQQQQFHMEAAAQAQAQAQYEAQQQRAMQQAQLQQYQQMAYQRSMTMGPQVHPQPQQMHPPMQHRQSYHGRTLSMQQPIQQPSAQPMQQQGYHGMSQQAGGYGGHYVQQQQQGVTTQYAQGYGYPQGGQQWRQPPQ